SCGRASSAVGAGTALARYGPPYSAAPSSSNTIACSAKLKPAPPYSSGIAMPCRPSWSPAWRQTPTSRPSVVSISSRTAVIGARSARNRRTEARSSSCSSVTPRIIYPAPFIHPEDFLFTGGWIGDDQHVQGFYPITTYPQRIHFQRLHTAERTGQLADASDDLGQNIEVSGHAAASALQHRQRA